MRTGYKTSWYPPPWLDSAADLSRPIIRDGQQFSMPALKRPTTTGGAGNFVALLIDDRVAAFPQIVTLARSEALLRIGPCDEEGDDLISLLRFVPQGVRLSAKPPRVETFEPKR